MNLRMHASSSTVSCGLKRSENPLLKKFEKSKNIFNTFSKTSENPEILNYLGLFALEDMKFIDAVKYFSKASAKNKNNPRYFYNLGNAYFFNGWFKEAVQAYLQKLIIF